MQRQASADDSAFAEAKTDVTHYDDINSVERGHLKEVDGNHREITAIPEWGLQMTDDEKRLVRLAAG
jgi:hypothetical protein